MMKSAFRCVQIVLLFYGVFGADEDEVKAVSVREGDSVTLHPLTQIQEFNLIEWRFRGPIIAQTDRKDISYPSSTEIFRGRLQLDQTGSLTIKNMKTKHSGLYKLQISHDAGTAVRKFNVTVYDPPSVIDAGESEMRSVSVMSGDPVTLQTGVTPLSGDEMIVWRFGDEGKLIAKADMEAKSSSLYYDERFRDRLELELDQTGSLIITNTRSTDSGFYTVKISSRTQTVYKRFSVSVSERGLSPGAVAGIVLLFLAVVAAAAVGFIYYRRKISELRKQILTVKMTGTEGDDVNLKPNNTIQKGDVMLWMFGEGERQTSIAKFIVETGEFVTHDYAADGRFRDILVLDTTTGSLTIRKSSTEHSGLYTLYITSSSGDSQQRFIVTVSENEEISVEERGSVTLKPDTEIQRGDQILWIFGDLNNIIAQIRGETGEICIYDDGAAGRFRDRLKLEKTGSLTITNIKPEHTGLYKLQISSRSSSRGIFCKNFMVSIPLSRVSVTAGESVHLPTDRPKIERDDEIQWMFGDEIIAEIKGGTGKTHDGAANGRFRDRLELDKRTGDLTIKSCTDEDTGDYKLKIISSKGNKNRAYSVEIYITWRDVPVTEGESVRLSTDRPEIERDDEIQWRFRGEIIAEIKGGTGETHDGADGRFRARLQLNDQTGDLTIKSFTDKHEGYYNLKIRSRKEDTNRAYSVEIRVSHVYVPEGESVRLSTDHPKIERDDEIQWMFGGEIIAEIKGGTGETHDGADGRFRDRLQLNDQTGDLTIKNSTTEDDGRYKLKIISRKGNKNKTYIVRIRVRKESPVKGNNGKRVDESAVEIPLLDK